MSEWATKLENWIRKQPVGASGGGFHPGLDMLRKALDEQATRLNEAWAERCTTSRAEGFAAAREIAAGLAHDWEIGRRNGSARTLPSAIRALQDGQGREACTCGAPDPSRPETLQAAHYADCPSQSPAP